MRTAPLGRILQEGALVVIVGEPNEAMSVVRLLAGALLPIQSIPVAKSVPALAQEMTRGMPRIRLANARQPPIKSQESARLFGKI